MFKLITCLIGKGIEVAEAKGIVVSPTTSLKVRDSVHHTKQALAPGHLYKRWFGMSGLFLGQSSLFLLVLQAGELFLRFGRILSALSRIGNFTDRTYITNVSTQEQLIYSHV